MIVFTKRKSLANNRMACCAPPPSSTSHLITGGSVSTALLSIQNISRILSLIFHNKQKLSVRCLQFKIVHLKKQIPTCVSYVKASTKFWVFWVFLSYLNKAPGI